MGVISIAKWLVMEEVNNLQRVLMIVAILIFQKEIFKSERIITNRKELVRIGLFIGN
jgi:hypothetical protein